MVNKSQTVPFIKHFVILFFFVKTFFILARFKYYSVTLYVDIRILFITCCGIAMLF